MNSAPRHLVREEPGVLLPGGRGQRGREPQQVVAVALAEAGEGTHVTMTSPELWTLHFKEHSY